MAFRLGQRRGRSVSSLGAVSAVGFALVLAIVIGAGAGYLLDEWLGTSPWLFLLGFFVGVAAGIRNVFRTAAASGRRGGDYAGPGRPS